MEQLNREHKIRLITLTPLSIGADKARELSPLADYILSDDERHIHLLPQSVLEPYFRQKPELINDFSIGIVKNMNNNRSDFDLRHFVVNRLGIDLAVLPKVAATGVERNSRLNIAPIVKDAGRPFLPGSSLKGAMRTAILYHWLLSTPQGKAEMQSTMKAMDTWFDTKDFKGKRDAEKQMLNEENLFQFGKRDALPLASQIIVRDSIPLSNQSLAVTNARRIRLKPLSAFGKASDIPQPRECIKAGTTLETSFMIPIGKIPESSGIGFLNERKSGGILDILTKHAAAFVRYELEKLTDCPNAKTPDVQRMRLFYHDLQDRMDDGEIFLRLGLGKTLYDNSLVLAILNNGNDRKKTEGDYADWADIFKKSIKNLHPVTRTVAADGLPFGWVQLQVD